MVWAYADRQSARKAISCAMHVQPVGGTHTLLPLFQKTAPKMRPTASPNQKRVPASSAVVSHAHLLCIASQQRPTWSLPYKRQTNQTVHLKSDRELHNGLLYTNSPAHDGGHACLRNAYGMHTNCYSSCQDAAPGRTVMYLCACVQQPQPTRSGSRWQNKEDSAHCCTPACASR